MTEDNACSGASVLSGMLQAGLTTNHHAGRSYTDKKNRSLGHFFVSSVGCQEWRGDVSVLPVTGRGGPCGAFDIDTKAEANIAPSLVSGLASHGMRPGHDFSVIGLDDTSEAAAPVPTAMR